MMSSVVVTRNPLSWRSALSACVVTSRSGPAVLALVATDIERLPFVGGIYKNRFHDTASPCPGRVQRDKGRTGQRSLPGHRALLPLVGEADRQNEEKHHHRPERSVRKGRKGRRPGEQEGDLEIENDEQDRDEIETHVELHPGVVE